MQRCWRNVKSDDDSDNDDDHDSDDDDDNDNDGVDGDVRAQPLS